MARYDFKFARHMLLVSLLFFIGVCGIDRATARAADDISRLLMNCSFTGVPGRTTQLLVVTGSESGPGSVTAQALDRAGNEWTSSFPPLDAVVGRNGFAEPGSKREGDGKTPSGMYPLLLAFGYDRSVKTAMRYRQATENDLWVDDPDAPDYNTWVKRGKTKAGSFEELRRKDELYRYGVVIGYNTGPVVKGRGSAIFLHIWKGRTSATAGCVAMAEKDVLRILEWLDPAREPLIMMGTKETVLRLAK